MSAPRISGILETALHVEQMRRSVEFYQRVMGLRLLESGERLSVFQIADKQVLLLFLRGATMEPVSTPGGVIPGHGGEGALHVAFAIPASELAAWEQHLRAEGVSLASQVNWPAGGRSLFLRDPDNHLVELATPGVWEVY